MKILAYRACKPEYYSPMVQDYLMRVNFYMEYVQILIEYLGEPVWINVKKSELEKAKETQIIPEL